MNIQFIIKCLNDKAVYWLESCSKGSHQLAVGIQTTLQLAFIISLSNKAKDSLRMKKAEILQEK